MKLLKTVYSIWLQPKRPCLFLVHAYDDDGRKMYASMLYTQKLFERNVPVEMHLFTKMGCTADLTGSEEIRAAHLAEALQYRPKLMM